MENEFLPVLSGIGAGILLGRVTARQRPLLWALLSAGLGLFATVVSGEFQRTWAYLLIGIPLVGGVAVAAFLLSRCGRRRQLRLA